MNVLEYILSNYDTKEERLWVDTPDFVVFRNFTSKKWFVLLMQLPKNKLVKNATGIAEIINLKCDPIVIGGLLNQKGIYPAYHMNKTHWISVDVKETEENLTKYLIDLSYNLTLKRK